MLVASRFAAVAGAMSHRFGGPFHCGRITMPGRAQYDDGGSIVQPAAPYDYPCRVQVDAATEAMRQAEGFTDTDVRLLIVRDGACLDLNTDAVVEVIEGPHVGMWSVQSVATDAFGVYWDCRGRKVT